MTIALPVWIRQTNASKAGIFKIQSRYMIVAAENDIRIKQLYREINVDQNSFPCLYSSNKFYKSRYFLKLELVTRGLSGRWIFYGWFTYMYTIAIFGLSHLVYVKMHRTRDQQIVCAQ